MTQRYAHLAPDMVRSAAMSLQGILDKKPAKVIEFQKRAYATTAPMDTFVASRTDRHPTDLAMLRGARLVAVSETEEGRTWAESKIKQLTGGDRVTARFMRQDFFSFVPQLKLIIISNHKPRLHNVDAAMRRRINIIPFTCKPKNPDPYLEDKLKGEHPQILQWMIDGCCDWQKNGLIRPKVVQQATADYFDTQDLFGQWLDENCNTGPGNSATASVLFDDWMKYAERRRERPGAMPSFTDNLIKRGFSKRRTNAANHYEGIALKPSMPFSPPPPMGMDALSTLTGAGA